jgi:outer membrane protein
MKKSLLLAGLLSTTILTSSNALPLLEGEIYSGYINQDPAGWLQYKGTPVDLNNDLGLGEEGSYFIKSKLNVPIPLIPNIYLQYVNMDFSGTSRLERNITIDNKTYTVGTTVSTDLKLDHYDIGFFYNVPIVDQLSAGFVNMEAGIDVRIIDFEAKVTDGRQVAQTSATIPLPLLYAGFDVYIPNVDFVSLQFEAKGIKYSDNYYYELSSELRLQPVLGMIQAKPFLAVGYRIERLRIDDIDDTYADIRIKQPYIAVGLTF